MYVSSSTMLVNLVLNYVLIYGKLGFPALGVEGAAIATVIARVVEAIAFVVLFSKYDFEFKGSLKETFRVDKDLQVGIFKKMVPLLINEVGFTTANILIFKSFAHTGTSGIALITIVDTIFFLFLILINGLGTATSIFVGNRLGAGKIEEANQNARWMLSYGMIMGTIATLLIILASPFLPHLYKVSPDLKTMITYALIIRSFTILPMIVTRIVIFLLRTGGRADQTMIVDGLFMWVVKVPVALLLAYYFKAGILLIYGIIHFTQFPNALISIYYYRKRDWLENITV
jgi:Na+-driven multidrug efflux pump